MFRSVHDVPAVQAAAACLLAAWVAVRIRRSRSAAEPVLILAWATVGVYLVGVLMRVLMMV
jgi:hypothetical protein